MTDAFLSDLIGTGVYRRGKKIGRLADVIVVEKEKAPEVTHVLIARPFGDPTLVIPWDRVARLELDRVEIDIDSPDAYAQPVRDGEILLKDHVLDKKVLDLEGKEVEVVYDVKLSLRNGILYVVGVDLSRYGLLRRVGLRWLARLLGLSERDRDRVVPWTYIRPLPTELGSFRGALTLSVLREELADMHPADVADILETMEPAPRAAIVEGLDTEHASDTFEEIDPSVQRDLVVSLPKERVADLINDMTPGQAADVLSVLPADARDEITALLTPDHVTKIRAILDEQDHDVVNYATTEILKVPPDLTAGEVQDSYRMLARGKEVVTYLYIVDDQGTLLGVLDLKELLQASDEERLGDVMTAAVITLKPGDTLKTASDLFRRYAFRAIPITDDAGRILGAVTYRDVVNLEHRALD